MAKNARIVIPRKIDVFLILNTNALAKNDADGATSVVGILNTTDWQSKLNYAIEKNDLGKQLMLDRKNATQQRNLALGIQTGQKSYTPETVLFYLSGIRDYLLGKLRGEELRLGEWGFDVKINSKGVASVKISRSVLKMLNLGKKVLAKHEADDTESVLTEFDMVEFGNKYALALEKHELTEQLNRDKESAFQQRDLAMGKTKKQWSITKGTLLYYITSARDILLGKFRGEEQMLGDWGFEVNTSSPTPPPPPPPATSVTGTVIDSVSLLPIGGVSIDFNTSAGPVQSVSNAQGIYTAVLDVTEMELVNVHINHPGYHPFNDTQAIMPGEDNEIDFSLNPV
jgi:hypothetical protein